ncbi:MAG: 4Fe-4S binding protein [Phormidesmis sp.]
MHLVRWVVSLAWGLLIVSLFYDPVSAVLTHPDNPWSWLADSTIAASADPTECIRVQSRCLFLEPYAIGSRVFWGMAVPGAIFIVLVFGHEFWRRICPLYFFSQIPRALGLKPLQDIERNQWLQNNHFYVQFVLFFLGITGRILLVNSVRPALGLFFILTLLSAVGVVALYGGRSWCHYVCPFGMVQTVFTGPRGLLDSAAHQAPPYSLTQSTCRTVDSQGQEQSACISCKSSCLDIDSEQAYWEQLHKPGRQLVQYGYLGLVVGYFCYYGLYAGSFDYYFSGVWSHESGTIAALLNPGFYVAGRAIAIPKLIAAPVTLAAFAAFSCWLCTRVERYYRGHLKRKQPTVPVEQSLHRLFSVCTFLAFNGFFVYGGRPEINQWPLAAQFGFQSVVAISSSLWLCRTWGRSREQYQKERSADSFRRQLKRLPGVNDLLGDHTLEQLSAEELSILARTLTQIAPSVDRTSQSLPQTVLRRSPAPTAPQSTTQIRPR